MSRFISVRQAGFTGRQIVPAVIVPVQARVLRWPAWVAATAIMLVGVPVFGATLTSGAKLTASCGASGSVGSGVVEFRIAQDICLTDPGQLCEFRYSISYSNLSSNATAAHLHDSNGSCAGSATIHTFPIDATTSGFMNASVSLSQAETLALFGGDYFFDIHTVANAGGEIKGQTGKDPKKMPTVSQWGLMSLTLLIMTAGTLLIARRSRRFAV